MRRLRSWLLVLTLCAGIAYGVVSLNVLVGNQRILAVVGDPLATQVVSQAWGSYIYLEYPDVDLVIAKNAGSLRSSRLHRSLVCLIEDSRDADVRRRAVYALGKTAHEIGNTDSRLVVFLRRVSSTDSDWGVREEAKLALTMFRPKS